MYFIVHCCDKEKERKKRRNRGLDRGREERERERESCVSKCNNEPLESCVVPKFLHWTAFAVPVAFAVDSTAVSS